MEKLNKLFFVFFILLFSGDLYSMKGSNFESPTQEEESKRPNKIWPALKRWHKAFNEVKQKIDDKTYGIFIPTVLFGSAVMGIGLITGHRIGDIFTKNNLRTIVPCLAIGVVTFKIANFFQEEHLVGKKWYQYEESDYTTKRVLGWIIGTALSVGSLVATVKCKRIQNNMSLMAPILFGFSGLCAGLKPTLCVQEQETKKDNEKVLN